MDAFQSFQPFKTFKSFSDNDNVPMIVISRRREIFGKIPHVVRDDNEYFAKSDLVKVS